MTEGNTSPAKGLKAIETYYKGYRFRSRLEARWAVFFDACGVEWEYEPEGFDLGDGIRYLPDFLLHDVTIHQGDYLEHCDLYVEVKGHMTGEDAKKILRFAELRIPEDFDVDPDSLGVLVVGNIPDGESINEVIRSIRKVAYDSDEGCPCSFNFETVDGDNFAAYPGVDTDGVFTLFGDDSSYLGYMDPIRTNRAYTRARQARFEFGETPEGRF